MKRRKAFTLIELLVVISVIALLLAILMPSLGRVKQQGMATVCKAHLHNWMYSTNLYTQDNDDKFWGGYDYTMSTDSLWWMHAMRAYYEDIDEIRCCPTATKVRWTYEQDPGPGTGKQPFTAWGILRDGWWINVDGDYGSFCLNGWLQDKPDFLCDTNADSMDTGWFIGNFWRKTSRMQPAAKIPILMDGQWIDAWPQAHWQPPPLETTIWNENPTPPQSSRYIQNRHNEKANCIFADGAVRAVGLKEYWSLKWHVNYNTNGPYTLAGGVTRGMWPEWMENMKDY